jgi:hypothetical protein
MTKKIMDSQSTSGEVPESGLDVRNHDGDSVEYLFLDLGNDLFFLQNDSSVKLSLQCDNLIL